MNADAGNIVYECPDCGEQMLERRCPDCNLFTRRLGPGGHCPHCDEITLSTDLFTNINTGTYTENLTSSLQAFAGRKPSGPNPALTAV